MNFNVNSMYVYTRIDNPEAKQNGTKQRETDNKEDNQQKKEEFIKIGSVSASDILAIYNTTIIPNGIQVKAINKNDEQHLAVDKGHENECSVSANLKTDEIVAEKSVINVDSDLVVEYCIKYNEKVNNPKLTDAPNNDNKESIEFDIANFKKQFLGEFGISLEEIENADSEIDINIRVAYLEVMLRFAKRYVRWADLCTNDERERLAAREMNDKYQNMLDHLHGTGDSYVDGAWFDPRQ